MTWLGLHQRTTWTYTSEQFGLTPANNLGLQQQTTCVSIVPSTVTCAYLNLKFSDTVTEEHQRDNIPTTGLNGSPYRRHRVLMADRREQSPGSAQSQDRSRNCLEVLINETPKINQADRNKSSHRQRRSFFFFAPIPSQYDIMESAIGVCPAAY